MPSSQPEGSVASLFAGPVADAILSADGTRLYVATGEKVVALDIASGATLDEYALGAAAGALDVSADGKYLVVIDGPKQFEKITLATGARETFAITGDRPAGSRLLDIAAAKDGTVVLAEGSNFLLTYDTAAKTFAATYSAAMSATLISSADHTRVFGLSGGSTGLVYASGRGIVAKLVYNPYSNATGSGGDPAPIGAISPDNKLLVQGSNGTLRSAGLSKVGYLGLFSTQGYAFSSKGDLLYVLGADGNIIGIDTTTRDIAKAWFVDPVLKPDGILSKPTPADPATQRGNVLQVTDDGRYLIALTSDGVARYDLDKLVQIATPGNDVITVGHTLYGFEGNDRLGGQGAQSMYGGRGDDTYVIGKGDGALEKPGEGIDTLLVSVPRAVLSDNIENLTYTGKGNAVIVGNAAGNVIHAGNGNDQISSGGGDDTIDARGGDDVIFAGVGNQVIDGGAGNDTVNYALLPPASRGPITVDLRLTVEQDTGAAGHLTLSGIENVIGGLARNRLTGNDADNKLSGGLSNDVLAGGAGNDVLDGGTKGDTMTGGLGDDTFYVDVSGDKVIEAAGEGTDTVFVGASFVLPDNVENGTAIDSENYYQRVASLTGNALDNILIGDRWDNVIDGKDGRDLLDGGDGYDTATYAAAVGGITLSLSVSGPQDTGGAGTDTLKSIENLIGSAFADRLTGTDATNTISGGRGADVLVGLGGNDTLDGGAGADTLFGGAGDDTYKVDNRGDGVSENSGPTGADPADAGGHDLVVSMASYNLAGSGGVKFVEDLTLDGSTSINGTGNDLANEITGNRGNNYLSGGAGNDTLISNGGNDVLDGGGGDDKLYGNYGNDTYVVDSTGDQVLESSPLFGNYDHGGADLVRSSVSFDLGTEGAIYVENLVLTGTADINGLGNEFGNVITGNSGANTLSGGGGYDTLISNGGNDVLDGGSGDDKLYGSSGNDTYIVDSTGDQVLESSPLSSNRDHGGTDLVRSSVSFNLGKEGAIYVENLVLTGTADINGWGNELGNVITGNAGANTLSGGGGRDILTGGDFTDTFVWTNMSDFGGKTAKTADLITDFSKGDFDLIDLSGVDAVSATAGVNEAFSFIGAVSFSGVAGQLRTVQSGTMTYLAGDTNGDKAADFMIALSGLISLASSDLVL